MSRLVPRLDGWVSIALTACCTLRVVPALPVVVALDDPGGNSDGQGTLRDVLAHDRSGAGPRAVPDGHRGDERRVDARLHARADRRAVLGPAVVVRGDVRGADVRAGADVGVPEVGQVRHLR